MRHEAQVESQAIAILAAAAASSGCQGAQSFVFGSSPQDLLASLNPFLTGNESSAGEQPFLTSPVAGRVGAAVVSAAKPAGPPPATRADLVLRGRLGNFPTPSRVVNDLLALALVALLGALVFLAVANRHAARHRQMGIKLAAHLEAQRSAFEKDLAETALLLGRSERHRGSRE